MGHWQGEGSRERLVREVYNEFAFLHPELNIELKFPSEILPAQTQAEAGRYIASMIRSGYIRWDVVWMDPLVYHHVALELGDWEWGKKHLVDFSEIPGFAETHKKELMDDPHLHEHTGGVFPGPYLEGFFYAMWYNRDVAEKLGLKISEEGMTYDELLRHVKAVDAYNAQAEVPISAFLCQQGSGNTERLFYNLLYSFYTVEEWKQLPREKADETVRLVLQMFRELGRYNPTAGRLCATWPEAAQTLIDGRALFYFDATWRYNAFEQFDPVGLKKLRLAQMPGMGRHNEAIGGYISTWAVMKNGDGREAGIELMKYWSRPAVAEKWVRYTKNPTGIKGNLYDPIYGNDTYALFQENLSTHYRRGAMDPLLVTAKQTGFFEVGTNVMEQAHALLRGEEPEAKTEEDEIRGMPVRE